MNFAVKNKKALILVALVVPAILVRLVLYIYVAIKGIGTFKVMNYINIVINLVMYVSIAKYIFDYFIKGKDVSLDSLIFKYGIASLVTLISLKNGNDKIFILTAITVFLVPYVSGQIHHGDKKKLITILVLVILALSIALSVFYIKDPIDKYIAALGKLFYNLDALNPAIEWLMFTILYFARGIAEKSKPISDNKVS